MLLKVREVLRLPTCTPVLVRLVNLHLTFCLVCHQQCKESQPSHVVRPEQPPLTQQWTPQVQSALDNASEVFCKVQRRRRILEENLQSLQRRCSAEALEGQLEALASNRLA